MNALDIAALMVVLGVLYHRRYQSNLLMQRARAVVVEQVKERARMPFI